MYTTTQRYTRITGIHRKSITLHQAKFYEKIFKSFQNEQGRFIYQNSEASHFR